MTTQEILLLPREEFVSLAESFYQRVVRPQVDRPENQGKPLALDLETERFVLAEDGMGLDAAARIREHNPNARPFLRRIGYRESRLVIDCYETGAVEIAPLPSV